MNLEIGQIWNCNYKPKVIFEKLKIPYLPKEQPIKYFNDYENEESAIKANKKLIEVYEQKIADVLSEI